MSKELVDTPKDADVALDELGTKVVVEPMALENHVPPPPRAVPDQCANAERLS